jgi:hypothetical protein
MGGATRLFYLKEHGHRLIWHDWIDPGRTRGGVSSR